jgi:predicted nucleic acid-binding protein
VIAVLDASAAVRVAMDPQSGFVTPLKEADLVVAPDLLVAEVCSAFRKYVRARMLSQRNADEMVARALALVDEFQPMRELVPEVRALVARSDSSVYDLFYVALAKRSGGTLLTADLVLRQAALKAGVDAPEFANNDTP